VAARHPDLRLIVDHAGLPSSGPPMAVHELIEAMVPLARYANVAVKASALPSTVAEAYPFPTAQDAAQRLVAEFGPQRVFWGTDMTRLKCSYAEAAHFLAEPGGLSADELTWVMGRALREWIHWHAETDADKREAGV